MGSHQDDLLQPTLRHDLDVTKFDRPWNPASLVYIAFFGGFAGGGALLAINAKRLGMRTECRRILLGAALLTVLTTLGLGWYFARQASAGDKIDAGDRRLAKYAIVLVAVLLAKWVAKRQQSSFEAYDYSDRPKGSLWVYGIAAVLFGVAVQAGLLLLAIQLFRYKVS